MKAKEGEAKVWVMEQKEKELRELREENQKLRQDNEMLMNTVTQMKTTLNRLIQRFVVGNQSADSAGC